MVYEQRHRKQREGTRLVGGGEHGRNDQQQAGDA
jgi:hypothetical protein